MRSLYFLFVVAVYLSHQPLLASPPPPDTARCQSNTLLEWRDYNKVIKKEFPISATGQTSIQNLYGKVNIKTWDKNLVNIRVSITVRAGSDTDARAMFDRISIMFDNSTDFVKAETIIENKSRSIWSWFESNSDNYRIDYEVFVPRKNNIVLANKYGDSFVGKTDGRVKADIRYGDVRMEDICNNLEATIAYGDGNVMRVENANINISYGNLQMTYVQTLDIDSGYSEVSVEQAGNIRASSKYDQYKIGIVNELFYNGDYSDVKVNNVSKVVGRADYTDYYFGTIGHSADFDLDYGSVNITTLGRDFQNFVFNGDYADCRVNIENGATYTLDAKGSYFDAAYPRALRVVSKSDKDSSFSINGNIGNGKSVIKIRMDYGSLQLK